MIGFLRATALTTTATLVMGGTAVLLTGTGPLATADGDVRSLTEDEVVDEPLTPAAGASIITRLATVVSPADADTAAQRVILSRDPFRPVVPIDGVNGTDGGADAGGTDGGGTDGTDGTGTDGTDGSGTDGTGTDGGGSSDGGGSAAACSGDEAETVCEGVVVTLAGFEGGEALVQVDGVTYPVSADEDFATSFRVLALNEPCVTLLYGDEAFSICTGATVLK